MRGEFIRVWSEIWREIWVPLIAAEDVPQDLFCELYRELAKVRKAPHTVEALADIIENPAQSPRPSKRRRPKTSWASAGS